jgi:hypothetical protein
MKKAITKVAITAKLASTARVLHTARKLRGAAAKIRKPKTRKKKRTRIQIGRSYST